MWALTNIRTFGQGWQYERLEFAYYVPSTNDIKLDDPKLRDCAHFILCLVTLGCRPHSSAFLWHWRLVRSLKKVG